MDTDLQITSDITKLIWAYNDDKPSSDNAMPQHRSHNRGTRSVHLLSLAEHEFSNTKKENIEKWDITSSNLLIPDETDTTYWCKIVIAPFKHKVHVVRVLTTTIIDYHNQNNLSVLISNRRSNQLSLQQTLRSSITWFSIDVCIRTFLIWNSMRVTAAPIALIWQICPTILFIVNRFIWYVIDIACHSTGLNGYPLKGLGHRWRSFQHAQRRGHAYRRRPGNNLLSL